LRTFFFQNPTYYLRIMVKAFILEDMIQ